MFGFYSDSNQTRSLLVGMVEFGKFWRAEHQIIGQLNEDLTTSIRFIHMEI